MWEYDFLLDPCESGQHLKCLAAIDEYTREYRAIDVAGGIRSSRVIEAFYKLISVHGAPKVIGSDHGVEFASNVTLKWPDLMKGRHGLH